MPTPDKFDDVIDSRDIIERLEELQGERDDLQSAVDDAETDDEREAAQTALREWTDDNGDELAALEAVNAEGEDYAEDWTHGATMIRESYFTDYCEEMLEDIGELPRNLPSYIVIDWDAIARNMRVDYSEIEFDGVTYLVR